MAEDIRAGGAYIEISADSAPAEKAVATFFNWFEKTGEKATQLASDVSKAIESVEDLGKKGVESSKKVVSGYKTIEGRTKETIKTVSDLRDNIDTVAKKGSASYQQLASKISTSNKSISKDTKNTFNSMKSESKASYDETIKDTKQFNNQVKKTMKESVQELGRTISELFKKPVDGIKQLPNVISNSMKKTTGFVSSGFSQAKQLAISQIDKIKNGITSIPSKTKSAFSSIKSSISNLPQSASSAASSLKTRFTNGFEQIKDKAKTTFDGVKKTFKNLPDEAEKSSNRIRAFFKSGLGVIASVVAVDKIIDFGKLSVQSAAAASAMEAQFEQVFTSVDDKGKVLEDFTGPAQEAIEEMAANFKMLPNRIKPNFSQLTSMFKGLGETTERAMEQAGRATTLAADSAAFYDKSMEDAQGSITSFLKGNYEAGESIGLFANDTQMAAYAISNNLIEATSEQEAHAQKTSLAIEKAQAAYSKAVEKFGADSLEARSAQEKVNAAMEKAADGPNLTKKWQEMTEAEKQNIRLSFAESMLEKAGAMGQANREGDSLENQLGNMKQAWADFSAIIGKPILPIVTAALQFMSEKLQVAGGWVEYLQDNWEKLETPLTAGAILVGALATAIFAYNKGLTLASIKTSIWNGIAGVGTTITSGLSAAFGFLTSPLTLVILGIGLLVAAFVVAYKKIEPFRNFIDGLVESIKNFAQKIYTQYIKPAMDSVVQTFQQALASIKKFWDKNGNDIVTSVINFFTKTWSLVQSGVDKITGFFQTALSFIKNLWDQYGAGILEVASTIFQKIWTVVQSVLDELKTTFQSALSAIKTLWETHGSSLLQSFKNIFNFLLGVVKFTLGLILGFWNQYGTLIISGVTSFFKIAWGIISIALNVWTSIFKNTFATIFQLIKVGWDTIKGVFSGAFKIIEGLIKIFTGIFTGDIRKVMDGIKDIFKGGWNVIASGIEGFSNAALTMIHGLAKGMVSGIEAGVNGVIKAINKLLDFFGKDPLKEVNWSANIKAPKKVTLPRFEKGTGGVPYDLYGVVNDQKGPVHRELIIPPKGQPFIPQGRDVVLPLQKGTQIVPARETKALLPHYEKGTGGFWNTVKGIAGNAWNNVKEWTGDVLDFIDDPLALVGSLFKKFIPDLSGFGEPVVGWTGALLTKAKDWIKDWFETESASFMPVGFDGSMSMEGGHYNNVYKYLVDVARKVIAKFPGLVPTSGYRPNDPYHHGKHQAIDIAYPGVVGSSKYTEAANWAFDTFRNQIAYVITNGRVRDRSGYSGTGSSGNWVRWPDNDHYDHIHLSGAMGAGDIYSATSSQGIPRAGSSASAWRGQIVAAAKMMGQSINNSEINRIIKQIQTESGGDQSLIQSSAVWDVNMANGNPARGLLQYIPQTFRAYAVRGYGNIMNGFHQLLAFFNNSNWRNERIGLGIGWGPTGRRLRGYENGGLVTQDGLYRMGEGNKPEMVIPLTKPQRAIELIMQAMSYLSANGTDILQNASTNIKQAAAGMTLNLLDAVGYNTGALSFNSTNGSEFSQIIALLKENNRLLADNRDVLEKIKEKDPSVILDGEKVSKNQAPYNDENQGERSKLIDRGLNIK